MMGIKTDILRLYKTSAKTIFYDYLIIGFVKLIPTKLIESGKKNPLDSIWIEPIPTKNNS